MSIELADGTLVDDKVEEVYALRKDALKWQKSWRIDAQEDFKFRDGDQWDSEDAATLEEQQRPVVTFNRCAPIIDSVVGYEQGNRQEVRYIPRTRGDAQANEVFTEGARWVRDECDAEDEESDSYADAVTCGMGWTETRVDYEEDPNGKIVIERVPPIEMLWDPNARKGNIADAHWVARETWLPLKELKERWPEKASEIVGMADGAFDFDDWNDEHDSTEAWKYEQDQEWRDPHSGKAKLIHYQYKERRPYYRVRTQEGEVVEFPPSRFSKMQMAIESAGLPYVKQQRWVYRERFITGMTLLEDKATPVEDHFSYHCITAKRDEQQHFWFGLMRAMKDPQTWANKFFSQTMHIMNSNAKGGILVENGAVDDKREFEENWASPEGVNWVNDGALSSGQIEQKSFGGYPSGLDRLLSFAISSIRDCTGVNMELLGMANRDQAGVLEQERKKAALVILAPLTSSLRRYRKMQGRALLAYMRKYIQPGTMMRITDKQVMPFYDDDPTVRYDVIVDTAPTSPNLKEEVWVILQNIVPAMVKAGVPLPPDLVRFSPLPESVADEWVKYIEERSQALDPQQMQKLQERLEKLMQENQQLKTKQAEHAMTIQQKREEMMLDQKAKQDDIAAKERLLSAELSTKTRIADADRMFKMLELAAEYDMNAEQLETQLRIAREKQEADLSLDREKHATKLDADRETHQMKMEHEREKNVASLEAERAKRSQTQETERQDLSGVLKQLESIQGAMDSLMSEMTTEKKERVQRTAKVTSFLKSKGLDVPDNLA